MENISFQRLLFCLLGLANYLTVSAFGGIDFATCHTCDGYCSCADCQLEDKDACDEDCCSPEFANDETSFWYSYSPSSATSYSYSSSWSSYSYSPSSATSYSYSYNGPCGCEEDGVTFCNFDDGDTGFCEACSGFGAVSECKASGLPEAGEDDCAARCFNEWIITGNYNWSQINSGNTRGAPNVHGNGGGDHFYNMVLDEDLVTCADNQELKISSCNSGFDTWLRIFNASGKELYSCDDCGECNTRTVATVPEGLIAGETYILHVEGYASNEGVYYLQTEGCVADTTSGDSYSYEFDAAILLTGSFSYSYEGTSAIPPLLSSYSYDLGGDEEAYSQCSSHESCPSGTFCAVECFQGPCDGMEQYEEGLVCQPCAECHFNGDSFDGLCPDECT